MASPIEEMIDRACKPVEAGFSPTPETILLDVATAAIGWWGLKCPSDWTLEQHLQSPEVNCVTNTERVLARTAAEWVRIGG